MSIYFLLLLVATAIAAYVLHLLVKQWRLANSLSAIPGLNPIWPFGDSLRFLTTHYKDSYQMYEKMYEEILHKKGPFVKVWLFHELYVFLRTPKAFEDILKSNIAITKTSGYDLFEPWLGKGLLISTGKLWHSRRKLLTPSFHFRILEHFLPVFNEHSAILVNILQEKMATAACSGTSGSQQSPTEISRPLTLCTLDIICATSMGKNIDAQRNPQSEYAMAVDSLAELLTYMQFRPWLQYPWIFNMTSHKKRWDKDLKTVHDFTTKVIRERKAEVESTATAAAKLDDADDELPVMGSKRRKAFLDTLLEAAAASKQEFPLTDQDIREEVDTFMFAGHDTTSAALTWTVHLVGHAPEVQRRIQEELNRIFGEEEEEGRAVEMKDLTEMKYLEAVIMESLRMVPPVALIARILTSDIEIDGVMVPAGVSVTMPAYMMHKNPLFYDDPHTFRPERFLDRKESAEKRHPFSFIGFSAGPRNCIGQKFAMMELKVVLSTLFRRFHVTSVRPTDEIRKCAVIVTKPLEPVDVILTPRLSHARFSPPST